MSLLDLKLSEVPDLGPVPDGEYPVNIFKCELATSKKGKKMVHAIMKVEGVESAELVHEYMTIPEKGDEYFDMQARRLKDFARCFDQDPDALDTERAVGARGFVILKTEESDEHGSKNRVKRFVFNQA